MPSPTPKVAMLTAWGLAPCLSSAVGGLIERYTEVAPVTSPWATLAEHQARLQAWQEQRAKR